MTNSTKRELRRYLRTGDHDSLFNAWPGDSVLARCQAGSLALQNALVAEVVERATSPADRRRLLDEYAERWVPTTDQVDPQELVTILSEAVVARNGWKRILSRCAPAVSRIAPTAS